MSNFEKQWNCCWAQGVPRKYIWKSHYKYTDTQIRLPLIRHLLSFPYRYSSGSCSKRINCNCSILCTFLISSCTYIIFFCRYHTVNLQTSIIYIDLLFIIFLYLCKCNVNRYYIYCEFIFLYFFLPGWEWHWYWSSYILILDQLYWYQTNYVGIGPAIYWYWTSSYISKGEQTEWGRAERSSNLFFFFNLRLQWIWCRVIQWKWKFMTVKDANPNRLRYICQGRYDLQIGGVNKRASCCRMCVMLQYHS